MVYQKYVIITKISGTKLDGKPKVRHLRSWNEKNKRCPGFMHLAFKMTMKNRELKIKLEKSFCTKVPQELM